MNNVMVLASLTERSTIGLSADFIVQQNISSLVFWNNDLRCCNLDCLDCISFTSDNISGGKIFNVGWLCTVKWAHSISIYNFSIVALGLVLCISLMCYTFVIIVHEKMHTHT